MSHSVAKQNRAILAKLLSLYNVMVADNALDTAKKVKELGRKTIEEEFSIAFCGHFSAGKSSMINQLIGEEILPSSPIPTSANLVRIKSGTEYAKVFYRVGGSRVYPAPYNYETVKTFCRDGDQIQGIEISHTGADFLENMVIMDTPGIDSTDDAHRIAAESALHLSDLVFYVMDYNHVQSELNFIFTKELTDAGKELYLIINQIDKHQDSELSFSAFKESVESSFAKWGVKHSGIFYTSLRDKNLGGNQFLNLRDFICERKENRNEILPRSIFSSIEKLAEDYLADIQLLQSERLMVLEDVLSDLADEEQDQLPLILAGLMNQKAELMEKDSRKELVSGLEKIVENAYLMPFPIRELAESYLESVQAEFKVGYFFSKQKTEQERNERLKKFHSALTQQVQTQLSWHLKEYIIKLLKENDLSDNHLLQTAQAFEVKFDQALLAETVKPGARLSGDYVLNYTNDLAKAINLLAKQQLIPISEAYQKRSKEKIHREIGIITAQIEKYEKLVTAWNEKVFLHDEAALKRRTVSEVLYGEGSETHQDEEYAVFKMSEAEIEIVSSSEALASVSGPIVSLANDKNRPISRQVSDLQEYHQQQLQLIEKLEFAAGHVEGLPGLKKIARELAARANRLKNKEFTVALFGAFSAGKSSFANALVGEKILPVSPNPTTAAINRIKPVTAEHPHKSVMVKIKDARQLLEEVNSSLKVFARAAANLPEAYELISLMNWAESCIEASEKTHISFLQAFVKGYGMFSGQYDQVLEIEMESLPAYVAEEDRACFVEWIDIYYDCELTRHGITLVDTPGADSINSRHTGVAFEYIKNSDAVLFVTYYNHAFSKADREFLIQLGRIKDTFELDKMFFIVNAVDLANSSEEQRSVIEYVQEQLIYYGIRNPHIYPISSIKGLTAKYHPEQGRDPLFQSFEQDFYFFIAHDLMKMAMEAAEMKWTQAVNVIEEMLHSAEEDRLDNKSKREKLLADQTEILAELASSASDLLGKRLSQEADELTYYIHQRVFFRFSEFFKEAFNPILLKDDGRNLNKALENALDDLLSSIGFDLSQEMRATTLRMEAFMRGLLKEVQNALFVSITPINGHVKLTYAEYTPFAGMECENAFQGLELAPFKKSLSLFKNPKSFFEKNEKKNMSDALENLLKEPAAAYLKSENAKLKEHYMKELNIAFQNVLEDLSQQINEYFEGMLSVLSDDFSVDDVRDALVKIKNS